MKERKINGSRKEEAHLQPSPASGRPECGGGGGQGDGISCTWCDTAGQLAGGVPPTRSSQMLLSQRPCRGGAAAGGLHEETRGQDRRVARRPLRIMTRHFRASFKPSEPEAQIRP